MELTREEVKAYKENAKSVSSHGVEVLCDALLSKMDAPKVWDCAPEWATKAVINWSAKTHYSGVYKEYTRTLAKSRIDEIAEEAASKWFNNPKAFSIDSLSDAIKAAILKDRKEREANR